MLSNPKMLATTLKNYYNNKLIYMSPNDSPPPNIVAFALPSLLFLKMNGSFSS